MRTRTTTLTEAAAQEAENKLKPIISKIVNNLEAGESLSDIRRKYRDDVGSIIATMIRTTYFLGHELIEKFAGRTIHLSEYSVSKMNQEIDSAIEAFWTRANNTWTAEQNKKRTEVIGAAGEESLIISAFLHFASQIATSLSFKSLGTSTITASQDRYRSEILSNGRTPLEAMLIWVSERDGRVCPDCINYDGNTYDANDPNIPTPGPEELGGDTHWGCRCRLLPEMDGKAFNA